MIVQQYFKCELSFIINLAHQVSIFEVYCWVKDFPLKQ
jgi:hypothetical protein